jgi:hypothetical protein
MFFSEISPPFTGIMVKTPKPIQVAILGPKNYRFGLMDPSEMTFVNI